MDRIFKDCNGVIGIADDITVNDKVGADHDAHIEAPMTAARKHDLLFIVKKCKIGDGYVKFFGHYYNRDDVRPFLGLLTLGEFIPELFQNTETPRVLLKQDTECTEFHETIFGSVINTISDTSTLKYG